MPTSINQRTHRDVGGEISEQWKDLIDPGKFEESHDPQQGDKEFSFTWTVDANLITAPVLSKKLPVEHFLFLDYFEVSSYAKFRLQHHSAMVEHSIQILSQGLDFSEALLLAFLWVNPIHEFSSKPLCVEAVVCSHIRVLLLYSTVELQMKGTLAIHHCSCKQPFHIAGGAHLSIFFGRVVIADATFLFAALAGKMFVFFWEVLLQDVADCCMRQPVQIPNFSEGPQFLVIAPYQFWACVFSHLVFISSARIMASATA